MDMLESDIIKRLQLNGSSYKTPRDVSRGVIPEPINLSAWDFDLGEEGPYVLALFLSKIIGML